MGGLETTYWGSFIVCGLLCFALQVYSRTSEPKATVSTNPNNARFAAFQRNYLIVFLLAMFSDWLQGPYEALMSTSCMSHTVSVSSKLLSFLSVVSDHQCWWALLLEVLPTNMAEKSCAFCIALVTSALALRSWFPIIGL